MTTLAPALLRLDACPLTGTIGAEIRGVDLREPLDDATAAEIRQLWLHHKVVFFPDQHLEPVHHVAFARHFGTLTRAHPVLPGPLPGHPEVLVLDSERARTEATYAPTRQRTREAGWHTDVTFVPTPPAGSVLSARVVPAAGGDTLWSDGEAAYAALDEPLRRLVDGLPRSTTGAARSGASSMPGTPSSGTASGSPASSRPSTRWSAPIPRRGGARCS